MSCSLTSFATIIGVQLVVRNRHHIGIDLPPWYATLEHTEVMRNGGLIGEHGNGATPDEALRAYAHAITGKRIAVDAMSNNRREFIVPKLDGI